MVMKMGQHKKKNKNLNIHREEVAKPEDLKKYLLQLCVCYATINKTKLKTVLRQAGDYLISMSERMYV